MGALGHFRSSFHLLDIHKVTIWCVVVSMRLSSISLQNQRIQKSHQKFLTFNQLFVLKSVIFVHYKSLGITLMLSKTSQCCSLKYKDAFRYSRSHHIMSSSQHGNPIHQLKNIKNQKKSWENSDYQPSFCLEKDSFPVSKLIPLY